MKLLFGMPGVGEWLWIGFALLLAFLLPFIVLIDIVRSDFKGQNDKLIWVLIVLLMNFIGSILYLMIGRKQKV
jgi:hypothetical protein